MSFLTKISSYFVLLYFSIKLRNYLSNKLRQIQSNDRNIDRNIERQIVLFFPETQIQAKDCFKHNYDQILSTNVINSPFCQLLSALKRSEECVDICLFSITFEPIIQLIQDLSQKGVHIRIITNGDNRCQSIPSEERQQKLSQFEPLVQLFRFGVELKFMSLSSDRLMHHKFAIIDNNLLINGSLNWSENSIFNSYNDCILTTDPKLVITYLREFNDIWSQQLF